MLKDYNNQQEKPIRSNKTRMLFLKIKIKKSTHSLD